MAEGRLGAAGETRRRTRIKLLYSSTGPYLLMDATDHRLTTTMKEGLLNLWTDERQPVYFEYEILPLGYELPIIIPNFEGKFYGWRPWRYEGNRRTRKATSAVVGSKKSGAKVKGWQAEVFMPYALLKPLQNVPPKPGSRWQANFYRVDYDDGKQTSWDWVRVGPSFHEYQKFGTLLFE